MAISFITLGKLGLQYCKQRYRGGVPSVIGAKFVAIGFVALVGSIEGYLQAGTPGFVHVLAGPMLFLLPGGLLLRHGLEYHKMRRSDGGGSAWFP